MVSTVEESNETIVSLKIKGAEKDLILDTAITKASLKEFDIRIDSELYLFFKVMSVEVF